MTSCTPKRVRPCSFIRAWFLAEPSTDKCLRYRAHHIIQMIRHIPAYMPFLLIVLSVTHLLIINTYMKTPITIAIAENHSILRQGLIALLSNNRGITVLFDVGNGQELLNAISGRQPEMVLLDLSMPVMDGKTTLRKLKELHPEIKVIILSHYFQDSMIVKYIRLGAHAYLSKMCGIDDIVEAVHQVHKNGCYYSTEVSQALVGQVKKYSQRTNRMPSPRGLSEKELLVLQLLLENKSNLEISDLLCLSTRTIEGYRSRILQKSGNKNMAALVKWAFQHDLNDLNY